MRVHIVGQIAEVYRGAEWFPIFNLFFIENYLSKHFDIEIKILDNTSSEPCYNVTPPYNSITIIHPGLSKAIIFSTFYDTRQLYNQMKSIIENFDTVIYSGHYSLDCLNLEWPGDINIIKPWLFRPLPWEIPEYNYNPKYNRLYFRGLTLDTHQWRSEVKHLEQINHEEIDVKGGYSKNYEQECRESKICLSLQGIRDMCNRDIELWSRGIPSIRPRFSSKLAVDIPDNIYIPVDFEYNNNITKSPTDPKKLAQDITATYFNNRDNNSLLKEISLNSREFYLQNFTPSKIANFTLEKIIKHFN